MSLKTNWTNSLPRKRCCVCGQFAKDGYLKDVGYKNGFVWPGSLSRPFCHIHITPACISQVIFGHDDGIPYWKRVKVMKNKEFKWRIKDV